MDQGKRMNVYFISGLGADRKAFERLKLPVEWTVHYLDWIAPKSGETLPEYARRLAAPIDQTKPFAFVGLSFGGMLASALHEEKNPLSTILISSIGCPSELPWYFRLCGRLYLDKLIPHVLINHPTRMLFWLFGARSQNEKKLLSYLLEHSDPAFIRWSLRAILTWKQDHRPKGIVHIHGNRDKILPHRYTHPEILIHNGSHFMVWTRAGEVSRAIIEGVLRSMRKKE